MKINVSKPITTLEGKALQISNEDGKLIDFTLAKACNEALLAANDKELKAEEKITRFELAKKIYAASIAKKESDKFVDFSSEEIVKIKAQINKVYAAPLVVAQCFDLLENK